jgi:hypothetical protein
MKPEFQHPDMMNIYRQDAEALRRELARRDAVIAQLKTKIRRMAYGLRAQVQKQHGNDSAVRARH